MVDILAWTGGDVRGNNFMYSFAAKYDFKKKQMIIETKHEEKGSVKEKLHDYKLSGKGYNLNLKTSKF